MTRARRLGRATFSSLRNRNYRLYFIGQIISVSGTWMQRLAQAWLILRLTHNNGFALGKDSNHRFMTDLAIYNQMIGKGWAGEGVVMCAPS